MADRYRYREDLNPLGVGKPLKSGISIEDRLWQCNARVSKWTQEDARFQNRQLRTVFPTLSVQYRQRGNELYKTAGTCADLNLAADYLKSAVSAYKKSMETAKDDEERRFALRNLGMANWHLGKNCRNRAKVAINKTQGNVTYRYSASHRTDYHPSFMLRFYKQAVQAFSRCLPLTSKLVGAKLPVRGAAGAPRSNNPTTFMEKLTRNLHDCATEALSYLVNMDYFTTYPSLIEQFYLLISACGDASPQWSAVFNFQKAKTLHKWALTEKERSNYVAALRCLKRCYSPMEMARTRNFAFIVKKEWEELQGSIKSTTAVAEAMKLVQDGDALLRAAMSDKKNPNIDAVHNSLSKYGLAIETLFDATEGEFRLIAECLSKIGQVYYNILKNTEQARTYCLQSVKLANANGHQRFVGTEWFDKASAILKEIQDKEMRNTQGIKKKRKRRNNKRKKPILKKLESELKKLEEFDNKSAETLITELPKAFVPKHKPKGAEELAKLKFTADSPRHEVKKALTKLILLYHPDHVRVEEHGADYFVLCKEVTKVITKTYALFK